MRGNANSAAGLRRQESTSGGPGSGDWPAQFSPALILEYPQRFRTTSDSNTPSVFATVRSEQDLVFGRPKSVVATATPLGDSWTVR